MKKIIFAAVVLIYCTAIQAQTEFDALKMVQPDINGTARYMGMAGAFGALGGDPSAISDNPAGLGIYRSSELAGTLGMLMQNSSSTWNGTPGSGDLYKLGMNSLSYVLSSPTWNSQNGTSGLLSSNFSFAYNRLHDFNRSVTINGAPQNSSFTDYMAYLSQGIPESDLSYVPNSYEPFNNQSVPWLSELAYEGYLINPVTTSGSNDWNSVLGGGQQITPGYRLTEKGYQDQFAFSWAGNFSNILYLGASINLQTINYSAYSKYSEDFGSNQGFSLNDTIYTNGTGFNLNIGAIVCPTDFLRFGLAVHTPTIYTLNDTYYSTLFYNTAKNSSISTPGGTSAYQLQSPILINASAAFILGQKGLLSVEYDYSGAQGTRLLSDTGDAQSFDLENQGMSTVANNFGTLKIGGEYRLNDNFSLRAGYAHTNNMTNPNAAKLVRYNTIRTDMEYFLNNSTDYFTAGFGYHEKGWYLDFAYMNKLISNTFYPYNSNKLTYAVNGANVSTSNNNLVLTLGFRF